MPNNDKIKIIGGYPLRGTIKIDGAKNAALPIIISAILSDEELILKNIPELSDIDIVFDILRELNVKIDHDEDKVIFNASQINKFNASYDLVSLMRASILVLGPLLSKYHQAVIPLPGGCLIGMRPIDLHIDALKKMGAEIVVEHGNIIANCKGGLKGAEIDFSKVSVGATEHIMMAAVLAKGKTVLNNAAQEPEIIDLANCLIQMGAKIKGAGTSKIIIDGVEKLKKASYTIMGDRIEAGSYIMATLATKGATKIEGIQVKYLQSVLDVLKQAGAEINIESDTSMYVSYKSKLKPVNVHALPYPDFPTDLQSILLALMTVADGSTNIVEHIFENRFTVAPELVRMGANIEIKGQYEAQVKGVEKLNAAEVKATDLRAAFALILAGLIAEGETQITKLHHLDRGYSNVVEKLVKLGAKITRGVDI